MEPSQARTSNQHLTTAIMQVNYLLEKEDGAGTKAGGHIKVGQEDVGGVIAGTAAMDTEGLTSFTLFPELAPKPRLKIWRHALPSSPPVLEVDINVLSMPKTTPAYVKFRLLNITPEMELTGLARACRQSRDMVLKAFPVILPCGRGDYELRFDPECTTIHLSNIHREHILKAVVTDLSRSPKPLYYSPILKLSFNAESFQWPMLMYIMHCFVMRRNIKEVTAVMPAETSAFRKAGWENMMKEYRSSTQMWTRMFADGTEPPVFTMIEEAEHKARV